MFIRLYTLQFKITSYQVYILKIFILFILKDVQFMVDNHLRSFADKFEVSGIKNTWRPLKNQPKKTTQKDINSVICKKNNFLLVYIHFILFFIHKISIQFWELCLSLSIFDHFSAFKDGSIYRFSYISNWFVQSHRDFLHVIIFIWIFPFF